MDQAVDYFWWAREFGWTPEVVDDLPVVYRHQFPVIAEVRAQVAAAKKPT